LAHGLRCTIRLAFLDIKQRIDVDLDAARFAGDMWEPYLKVIREKCSEALHILDRFHIVAKMNKALDEVRAEESRRRQRQNGKWLRVACGGRYAESRRRVAPAGTADQSRGDPRKTSHRQAANGRSGKHAGVVPFPVARQDQESLARDVWRRLVLFC
jgi:hypothetical protein